MGSIFAKDLNLALRSLSVPISQRNWSFFFFFFHPCGFYFSPNDLGFFHPCGGLFFTKDLGFLF